VEDAYALFHGGSLGTPHGLNSQLEKLSDQIVTAWTNFARTGNPNGQGNFPWPRYEVEPGKSSFYLFQNIPALSTFTDADFSAAHKCDFWDATMSIERPSIALAHVSLSQYRAGIQGFQLIRVILSEKHVPRFVGDVSS